MNNKTAGHTPEKWEVRMIGKEVTVAVVGSEKIIAFVETEENARLIAAAPELLSTLRSTEGELMAAYGAAGHSLDSARSMPSVKVIRRIITKIEGK